MKIEEIKISKIKPNPNNPRLIKDEAFEKLVKSIKEFPEMLSIRPIVINEDNIVLGGNMRLKACIAAGLKNVPIIRAKGLTQEQQKEFIIKDNVSGGEWAWDILANEWNTEELSEWGLEVPDFVDKSEAQEDEFDVPEGGIETDIVLGDLFEIGQHRLLCGDSTCSDTVAKLMNGKKADMVFTDPPYGVSYKSNMNNKFEVIKNDDVFLKEWMPQVLEHSKGFIFMWTSFQVLSKWIDITKEYFGDITNMIIWSKGGGGLGDLYKRFATDYEIALVWNRGETLKSKRIGSVWDINKDNGSSYQHPTQKPIELMAMGIENCSIVGNIIMDLFLGSGSTMVASHQLNRKCYGIELDPKYCQVIINRMLNLDPSIKIKLNGKPYQKLS